MEHPRRASSPGATDAELLSRIARAERHALGVLYDRHAATMLALSQHITGDSIHAQDLLHDIFLEVWRCAADYDPARGTVITWLLVRTRSRSLDERRRQHRSMLVQHEPFDSLPSLVPLPDPDSLVVRRAILDLPDDLRVTLVLGYFAGMTSTEIAVAMNIPLGTVKSRVARALSTLRQTLR
jgi:RNA polymerase sigma-70 factor, ECF subfamily